MGLVASLPPKGECEGPTSDRGRRGLVAITPACGNVAPPWARSGSASAWRRPRPRRCLGALASGFFAVTLGSGIESNAQQVMVQLKGIVFVMVFAPIATAIILAGLKVPFGSLRATTEDQIEGLDLTSHSESVYGLAGGGVVAPKGMAHGEAVSMSMATQREHLA
jgi:hypothetical protein